MATVRYRIFGKSDKKCEINLYYSNGTDVQLSSGIRKYVIPKNWDSKSQLIKNVIDVHDRDTLNKELKKLKAFIETEGDLAFGSGKSLTKEWLVSKIAECYLLPAEGLRKAQEKHKVFFVDFCKFWIEKESSKYLDSNGNPWTIRSKQQHLRAVELFQEFQKNKSKELNSENLQLSEVNHFVMQTFSNYLNENNYGKETCKKFVSRIRFLCDRAVVSNLIVSPGYKIKINIKDVNREAYLDPYFTMNEIIQIYNHDFSECERLDNARDWLIIGLKTGLRVSDFLNKLDLNNFKDGFQFIDAKTQKTKTNVSIPVHWMITEILEKRNGKLPRKISNAHFNEYIKEVCRLVGFDQMMYGGIFDPESTSEDKRDKRKIYSYYKKWQLVTSHICRRSMATNLYMDKVENRLIMAICGWSTEAQMLKYIKASGRLYAVEVQKVFESQYELEKQFQAKMKIVA